MKNNLLVFAALLLSTFAYSQTETLFSGNASYGGFGGPLIEFSSINGTLVNDVGGGGALIINNFFVGGYGLGSDNASVDINGLEHDIDFSQGGFWFGYTHKQHKLIHLYSSVKVGWGEAELLVNEEKRFDENLLAFSPDLGLEFNVTSWFKLGVTAGYRFVSGLDDLPVLDDNDFSGMTGGITFRFGGFGDYNNNRND